MWHVFYNMGLWDFQIIAICFYTLHLTKLLGNLVWRFQLITVKPLYNLCRSSDKYIFAEPQAHSLRCCCPSAMFPNHSVIGSPAAVDCWLWLSKTFALCSGGKRGKKKRSYNLFTIIAFPFDVCTHQAILFVCRGKNKKVIADFEY